MAEASAEALTRALSLLNIRRENSAVVLKPEQETAINNLLNGRDVMAILPTGFGKSMIYTVFALAKEEISSSKTCVIVIVLLFLAASPLVLARFARISRVRRSCSPLVRPARQNRHATQATTTLMSDAHQPEGSPFPF